MSLLRLFFRALRLQRDARALRRGPTALGKRLVRRRAHRALARTLRRL